MKSIPALYGRYLLLIDFISSRNWNTDALAAMLSFLASIGRQRMDLSQTLSLPIQASRPLDGRVAVITGSTSGIGLGIASALAEAGAMIVLNGLGDEAEIDNLRSVLSARHDVAVRYDGADMADSADIAGMIE